MRRRSFVGDEVQHRVGMPGHDMLGEHVVHPAAALSAFQRAHVEDRRHVRLATGSEQLGVDAVADHATNGVQPSRIFADGNGDRRQPRCEVLERIHHVLKQPSLPPRCTLRFAQR